jgi:multidrug efflux pump subunit AcrB
VLHRIVRWSLQRPRLVVWAALWAAILSLAYVRDMKLDLLPALAPAQADVGTEAPGLVAEQVEAAVTQPIENVLLGTPGVASVTSRSVQGLSVVTLRFAPGADPDRVRAEVTQNLGRVGTLPAGAGQPRLSPPTAPGPDLIRIGFTSDKLDPMALRDVVQWAVRPRLLSTPGVASVAVYGGQVRRIEVRARPGDLSDSDLGFLDIVRAAQRATSVAGAGFIDTPNQRVLIEPHGQAETIDQVKDGQIQTPGADPIRIDDVADVSEEAAPSVGDALVGGKPAVIVVVGRAVGANTVDATHAVEHALSVLQPSLTAAGVAVRTDLDRPASVIVGGAERLMWDLGIGVALVAVALAIFMRDARVVLVSLVSAPLTFLVTLAALKALGFSLNPMTLGGLAVALGLVIDDAVVDVESILSDLLDAESRHRSRLEAILGASLEVRGPVVYAMLALALSLVPLLLLPGPERVLLAPLALAIIVAALASLAVAATVTPALALLFFQHVKPERTPAPIERMKAWQARWLVGFERRSWPLLAGAAALALIALAALMLFPSALLPTIHDDHLLVDTDAPAATAPAAVRAAGAAEARDLAAIPGVRVVSQQIGRDPTADSSAGIQHSVFDIGLAPGLDVAAQADAARRVARTLADYPGAAPLIRSGLDRGEASEAGVPSLQVAVSGQDLDAVDDAAAKVAAALAAMPGRPTVRAPVDERSPAVRVDLDFNRLALFGLSAADVLDTVQAAFAGETVARIYRGSRAEDLVVLAQDSLRQDPEGVGDLLLRSTSTSALSVPLRSIANVYLTDGRGVIEHGDGARSQTVTAIPPPGGDIDRFAADTRAALHKVALPPGVFLDVAVSNSAAEARHNLALAYGLGLFAVFAFLAVSFDGRTAALILASTLLSFVGAAIAVALLGELTLGSMAGLVALIGLSMRNAILLIDRAETLALAGGGEWGLATVTRAAGERFAPLAASTLLAALALAPIAVQAGAAGMEVLGPMAIVIIAGLVTGAIGDLLVLPIAVRKLWRPGLGPSRPEAG